MLSENFILCAILGVPLEGEHALSAAVEDLDVAPLPLAMALAQTGRIDDLCRLLRLRSDIPFGAVAACALFVGLTRDPGQAVTLFRVLREAAPLDADVWLAIARFEAAIGNEAAACARPRFMRNWREYRSRLLPVRTPRLCEFLLERSGLSGVM